MKDFIGEYQMTSAVASAVHSVFDDYAHLTTAGAVNTDEIRPDRKQSRDLNVGAVADDPRINDYLHELRRCVGLYVDEYEYSDSLHHPWRMVEFPNIQHYEPGEGFKVFHCERNGTRFYLVKRFLAFMTYLCDIPEEEGGGTEFFYQERTFPCSLGKTLIWPAEWTHTHRGVVCHTRPKRIITGWFSYLDPEGP